MLWVVTPTYDRSDKLLGFIDSLENQTFREFTLVLVDHGVLGVTINIKNYNFIRLLREDSEKWWSSATNAGVLYVLQNCTEHDAILIINDDVILNTDYLGTMLLLAKKYTDSLIGSVCVDNFTGNIQGAGLVINKLRAKVENNMSLFNGDVYKSDVLSGRGMLVPVPVFKDIGLFSEMALPHYAADYEFSCRARKNGYELYVSKDACVYTENKTSRDYVRPGDYLDFLKDRKKPGNLPSVVNFSSLCMGRFYSMYFIAITFMRLTGSYIKSLLGRND